MEGANFFVEVGCPDEQEPAGGNDRTAIIFRAGVFLSLRREFRVFTKRNFADKLTAVQIDGVQSAPRGSDGGISFRFEKLVVTAEAIGDGRWRRRGGCELFALTAQQKADHRVALIFG